MKRPAPLDRQVLDALPITIYSVDLEGRLTFLNRSWSRFAGSNGAPQLCDEGAVLGGSIWDSVVDPVVREQLQQAMATLRNPTGVFTLQIAPSSQRLPIKG